MTRPGRLARRRTRLAAYARYALRRCAEDPWYLTDLRLSDLGKELYGHFAIPPAFASWLDLLPAAARPELCWVFVGPAGSGTPAHVDLVGSSAWNAVFAGAKDWTFHGTEVAPRSPLTCRQEAGDLVYTPAGWIHGVTNVSPCVALTGNFVNAADVDIVLAYLTMGRPTASGLQCCAGQSAPTGHGPPVA